MATYLIYYDLNNPRGENPLNLQNAIGDNFETSLLLGTGTWLVKTDDMDQERIFELLMPFIRSFDLLFVATLMSKEQACLSDSNIAMLEEFQAILD
jgi:hypothetical protein